MTSNNEINMRRALASSLRPDGDDAPLWTHEFGGVEVTLDATSRAIAPTVTINGHPLSSHQVATLRDLLDAAVTLDLRAVSD